jgi:putative ABC transport system permease protein
MLKAMLGEAWLAMGANRLRTALTMLGMVIGVGAVVIMMAIGQGAQYAVQQTISTMGSNLYIVLSGSFTAAGVRSGSAGGPTLNVGDAEAMAELDGVSNVAPTHQGSRQLVYGSQNWSTQVIGTTPPTSRRGPGISSMGPPLVIPTCAPRRACRADGQDRGAEPVWR